MTVITLLAPAARLPTLQLKLGTVVSAHVTPGAGVIVPRVKPAGQVSVKVTPAAFDGPAFDTVIV